MTQQHPEINTRPQLPEIFPQKDVTVEGEEHIFEVAETDSGTQKKLEYTLDKAPVQEVESIQGTDENGNSRTFSNGVDYNISTKTDTVTDSFTFDKQIETYALIYTIDSGTESVSDNSGNTYNRGTDYEIYTDNHNHQGDILEWLDGGDTPESDEGFSVSYDVTFTNSVIEWDTNGENLPQANSQFFVTYRSESVISRYLESHEDELDGVTHTIEHSINNKFVDRASGDALDELGKLFGPTIGKRRGRSDEEYRTYLKSVVQSFVSRGTVNGIKLAISAATGIDLEDIEVEDNFSNTSYRVVVVPNTPVTGSLIEEIAEIADPSGVDQSRTIFPVTEEEVEISDDVNITEGITVAIEDVNIDDNITITEETVAWGTGTWNETKWAFESN